ncbi:MAG: DUF86 domain-containing protein [Synechococcus sp.]
MVPRRPLQQTGRSRDSAIAQTRNPRQCPRGSDRCHVTALYLEDILSSIAKIQRYTASMTRQSLVSDDRTFDAVVYNLQIIGG